ncbi:uncharacterized protein LOC119666075 [Teleopsis dalmanni]|uniref:uncharacterized protein LOC119666075 n=1 Tax=Teleopsis dalmanni TaxID=139649 RepID=UPI0018CF81E5|nr:uncharacterized protein LOC119666075 [Teleopsis dalmanni]
MLVKDEFVPKTHNLTSLTPFVDEEGVIRVGGRVSSSTLQFDAIHQMILPNNDPLVKLLVEKIHKNNYHCGAQALLAQVRQRFWPLKGKSLMRAVIQQCLRCRRARPIVYNQIMGNLPGHRVQPARPFLSTGVDYCGSIWVHYKTRGKRPQKAYIAVFCCFATKAVHLELVTDLTTDAFIGALKRFIAKRGRCKTLYCDNATNFVGAKNKLQEPTDVIYADRERESIAGMCSTKDIEFHFIPPRSPHFDGLWEAAVKSVKYLLVKNVSTASLTYEELETVVIEVETVLNSRPLIPSSSGANDLNAITPGHFLIGEEITSSVDVHARDSKEKLLKRWQLVSELKHSFWQRWT